jgi:hypothetical protein
MKLLTFVAAAFLLAGSSASAEVRVSIHDGLVTVIAKDATVRQIMAEWARVGQAKVVNADTIPGGPLTLELVNVPETQVLDTLLRSVAGYLAAPRAVLASNLSRFDRVVVMATSSAPRAAATTALPVFQSPQFPQPPGDDDPDELRPSPNAQPPNGRGPAFGRFAQPLPINPQTGAPMIPTEAPVTQPGEQPATYPSTPSAPFGGVAVPGMIAPAPQQAQPGQIGVPLPPANPNQPALPNQPGQVRRPGGQ